MQKKTAAKKVATKITKAKSNAKPTAKPSAKSSAKPAAKNVKAKATTKAKPAPTKKIVAVKAKAPAKKPVSKPKKKVAPIPKGYNNITPYLIVKNAPKAIEFYKKAFAAKEVMRMDKGDGKISHAELKIGDTRIMLADECLEMGAKAPSGPGAVSIHLYTKNADATVAAAQAEGAKIVRPLADMFYGDRIGTIEDPFGHHWHVSTHIEDVSMATVKKRAAALKK